VNDPHRRNLQLAAGTVLATSTTLVCCVLPVALVTLGAGSVLASLVSALPQLVWLSENKGAVFGIAGLSLAGSGIALWNARRLPCPSDVGLAARCAARRQWSVRLYVAALVSFALGGTFAYLLPYLATITSSS
jgi:hypothetical protein